MTYIHMNRRLKKLHALGRYVRSWKYAFKTISFGQLKKELFQEESRDCIMASAVMPRSSPTNF